VRTILPFFSIIKGKKLQKVFVAKKSRLGCKKTAYKPLYHFFKSGTTGFPTLFSIKIFKHNKVKNGSAKLEVFLEGNNTAKPNATVSVSVKVVAFKNK